MATVHASNHHRPADHDHRKENGRVSAASDRQKRGMRRLRSYLMHSSGSVASNGHPLVNVSGPARQAVVHSDANAGSILTELETAGLAIGRHVLLHPELEGLARLEVLEHELNHVRQTGAIEPDFVLPFSLGGRSDAAERDAESGDASSLGTLVDANVIRRYTTDVSIEMRQQAAERRAEAARARRDRERRWRESHGRTHEGQLDAQARTLSGSVQQSRDQLTNLRAGAARALQGQGVVPPDMVERVQSAAHAVIMLEAMLSDLPTNVCEELDPSYTEQFRPAFASFYVRAIEIAEQLEQTEWAFWQFRQTSRQNLEQAEQNNPRPSNPCPGACHQPANSGANNAFQGVDWTRYMGADPTPEPHAFNFELLSAASETASTSNEWRQVINNYHDANTRLDRILISLLPATTEEERRFRDAYQASLDHVRQLEEFEEDHPNAVRIPAVFYPENKLVETGEGSMTAEAIQWEFYLEWDDDEWRLFDMTRQRGRKEFTAPMSAVSRALMESQRTNGQEVTAVPPDALFEQLNNEHLFPLGVLYFSLPSGETHPLNVDHPWGWDDWLSAIGMGLGALALITVGAILIIGSGGAATPLVAGGALTLGQVATGLGIASGVASALGTYARMEEMEDLGVLSDSQRRRMWFQIGVDIVSSLAMGLGAFVRPVSQAGSMAARLSAGSSRMLVFLNRANTVTQGVALAGEAAAGVLAASDIITAFNQLSSQHAGGAMTDQAYEEAMSRLVLSGIATGLLTFLSVNGQRQDFIDARNPRVVQGPDGLELLSDVDAGAPRARTGDAEGPDVRADGQTPPSSRAGADSPTARPGGVPDAASVGRVEVGDDVGWTAAGRQPDPLFDPNLERSAVVDVRYASDGTIAEARIRYGPLSSNGSGRAIDPGTNQIIELHQQVLNQFTGIRGQIRRLAQRIRVAFGGQEVPLHIQMEIWKHRRAASQTLATLRSGRLLSGDEITALHVRLDDLDLELNRLRQVANDPLAASTLYDPNVIALRVPEGFPEPPAGFRYRAKAGATGWELVPRGRGRRRASFDVEIDPDTNLPTGNFTNRTQIAESGIIGARISSQTARRRLEQLGYIIRADGTIARPRGHGEIDPATGFTKQMEGLTVTNGRIQRQTTESIGEWRTRQEAQLDDAQREQLRQLREDTPAHARIAMVEGIVETGVRWNQVLTRERRRALRELLVTDHGVSAAEADRLIQGLVRDQRPITFVLGTRDVRGSLNYRQQDVPTTGTAQSGLERHHGWPLYLGGGHEARMLFDLAEGPHDALHQFFDALTLPQNSALGAVRLDPSSVRRAAQGRTTPAAVRVDRSQNASRRGRIEIIPLGGSP